MKTSKNIFIRTWGETAVATISIGLFGFLFMFGITTVLVFAVVMTQLTILIPFAILIFIFAIVFLTALDKIYRIILYIYAATGEVPEIIENKELIQDSVIRK
jgi:hypothetical protein